jgi:hypothetical protein
MVNETWGSIVPLIWILMGLARSHSESKASNNES